MTTLVDSGLDGEIAREAGFSIPLEFHFLHILRQSTGGEMGIDQTHRQRRVAQHVFQRQDAATLFDEVRCESMTQPMPTWRQRFAHGGLYVSRARHVRRSFPWERTSPFSNTQHASVPGLLGVQLESAACALLETRQPNQDLPALELSIGSILFSIQNTSAEF